MHLYERKSYIYIYTTYKLHIATMYKPHTFFIHRYDFISAQATCTDVFSPHQQLQVPCALSRNGQDAVSSARTFLSLGPYQPQASSCSEFLNSAAQSELVPLVKDKRRADSESPHQEELLRAGFRGFKCSPLSAHQSLLEANRAFKCEQIVRAFYFPLKMHKAELIN